MRLNVSAWSIRQPVPSVIAFLILMVVGWSSFKQLPITRFPNIDVPIIQTRVYQAGAAPVELETQVTTDVMCLMPLTPATASSIFLVTCVSSSTGAAPA